MLDGFEDRASINNVCWIGVCVLCAEAIITSDCNLGESPLLSSSPADIGGEIGWLV